MDFSTWNVTNSWKTCELTFTSHINLPVMKHLGLLALFITFLLPVVNNAQTAEEYYSHAMVAKNEYDYKSALELMDMAIELKPKSSKYHVVRGELHFGMNHDQRALDDFDRAIELDPEDSWARIARGEYFLAVEEYDAAYVDANMGYYLAISNTLRARCRLLRARILRAEGKMGNAIAELEKGLQIDSTYVPGLQEMADILTQWGAFKEAESYLQKCIHSAPNDPLFYCNMGYTLAMQGKYQEALNFCNRALDYDPSFPMALANRGFVYYKMNNLNLALKDLKESIRHQPYNGSAWYFQSLVRLARKQDNKACKCLENTVKYGAHEESMSDARELREQYCD